MEPSGPGRFEIHRKLGAGGMGVVYEAMDRRRNAIVALKKLRRVNGAALYRFKREFRSLARIAHPNLVSLFELVSSGEDWLFTMELVRGVSLLDYVRPGGGQHDASPGDARRWNRSADGGHGGLVHGNRQHRAGVYRQVHAPIGGRGRDAARESLSPHAAPARRGSCVPARPKQAPPRPEALQRARRGGDRPRRDLRLRGSSPS